MSVWMFVIDSNQDKVITESEWVKYIFKKYTIGLLSLYYEGNVMFSSWLLDDPVALQFILFLSFFSYDCS